MPALEEIIDLDRYPLRDPGSRAYRALLRHCREELDEDGCVSLPGFVRRDILPGLVAMSENLFSTIHHSKVRHSLYGGDPDDASWPPGHPRRHLIRRTGGFICADLIPPDSPLWAIYHWQPLMPFLADAFGHSPLYRYADPIACMPVNVMAKGQEFPWHFDTNEYTVTIMIRPTEAGGAFEYSPFVRTPTDERYEAVQAVLEGDRSTVKTLPLAAGDLQLFKGRYTLHRVTEVAGATTRLVCTPSFSTVDGMVGTLHRMLRSYGRALPIHYERAGVSPDTHLQ